MYGQNYPPGPSNPLAELRNENNMLRTRVQTLTERVTRLEAENAHLRSLLPAHAGPPAGQVYASPSDNALALPAVVESLAVLQAHFTRQGTLKQW